jgi:hydroxylysine kinase
VVRPNLVDCSWDIAAVLDFGDTQHSCYLFELAICICYMMLLAADSNPLEAGGHVIAGYSMIRPLPDMEFSILKVSKHSICLDIMTTIY